LEALPLFGREDFLQTLVGLPSDFIDLRFRFFAQRLQARARIAEDLMDLCFLIGIQLQAVQHLFEAISTVYLVPGPRPGPVSIQPERAGRATE
jgi:hypothetical protein